MVSFNVSINSMVRQSNNLVESPYAQEFTAYEIKIFEIAVAACTTADYELVNNQRDKQFDISNSELAKLLNTKPSAISAEIEKTAARIMKKTMHLRKVLVNGTIEFEMINIIPFARYKDGVFQFRLNYSIIPYLVEINKNFTEYQLNFLLSLSSSYSIKLYKLLYQYKNIKFRMFSVEELKNQFGIINKYPLYKNFKQKIIEPSILQINNHTDLLVSYSEIKCGRKVEKLEFTFEIKKILSIAAIIPQTTQTSVPIKSRPSLETLLKSIEADITATTMDIISKYYRDKGIDYIKISIDYAKKHAKTNLDKYLNDTLINGWAEADIKKSKIMKDNDEIKLAITQRNSEKKKQEQELNNLAKSTIEHEWSKLLDCEKQNYLKYADVLFKKYASQLRSFSALEHKLPLCIYAVSNAKFYDRMLEGYVENVFDLSLNINDHLIR